MTHNVEVTGAARLYRAASVLTAGLGVAASFSRPCLIEVLDTIHDALHSSALAAVPNALFVRKPAPRLNQEFLL